MKTLFPEILFQNSPALGRYLSRHPGQVSKIADVIKDKPAKIITHFAKEISLESYNNVSISLRYFRYNTLAALAGKYLSGKLSTIDFCSYWSEVAKKCCESAYLFSRKYIEKEFGKPVINDTERNETDLKFSVIAVGKLGAEELNLSSDIDILFIFNSHRGHLDGRSKKSVQEFAVKVATTFTQLLSSVDENGFCFRVDNNLRPGGNQGPLANSIESALSYYEYYGTEFERMMLIRANPIAGDIELGNEFVSRIKPFVYRRTWDIAALKKIREMKKAVEQEALKSKTMGVDVKRGEGGIREVEFIIHSLQLLHGGKKEKLIKRNTIEVLEAAKKIRLIPSKQYKQLKESYIFLRHLENMIQLPNDEQTHILPNEPARREKLAEMMGLTGQQLMTGFSQHTEIVKHHFQHIFQNDFERQRMENAILTNISTCKEGEEEVDSLPWFKKEETKRIQFMDLQESLPADQVSEKLSLVAEVVISEAYKIASQKLKSIYGAPLADVKGRPIAGLSIIGVGKLGGREIDYASDLDMMFIFSTPGTTAGPQKITNQEYFTKLSQRILSIISMPTRYGKAYRIDTDLRPSGRAGILVTSLDSFVQYHNIEAMIWERQALLKARPIAGDPKFCQLVQKKLDELRYETMLPADLKKQIHELRVRMEKERAEESEKRFNIKMGYGGLMDIEMLVQHLQLKNGALNHSLRTTNTLTCLKAMIFQKLIDEEDLKIATSNYETLRKLLSRIRLFVHYATDHIDTESNLLDQIAKSLGLKDRGQLIDNYLIVREENRKIYNKYLT